MSDRFFCTCCVERIGVIGIIGIIGIIGHLERFAILGDYPDYQTRYKGGKYPIRRKKSLLSIYPRPRHNQLLTATKTDFKQTRVRRTRNATKKNPHPMQKCSLSEEILRQTKNRVRSTTKTDFKQMRARRTRNPLAQHT